MLQLVLFAFIIIFSFRDSYAQFGGNSAVPVLVKGIVTEETSGKPIGVDIEFRDSKGKKIKINSNSISGLYEQLLNAGETYTVILNSEETLRKTETITIESSDKFNEQKINFTVQKLSAGTILYKLDGFTSNASQINNTVTQPLAELQDMLKFNRSIIIEFQINAHDTYSTPSLHVPKAAPKKGKKSKATPVNTNPVKEPDADMIKNLVDSRIAAIKTLLDDNSWKRFKNRVGIAADYSPGKSLPGTSIPESTIDFLIIVKSVKNSFE